MNFIRCIVPIQRHVDARRFEQFGTGVLLKIGSRHLLLSAAHVILNDWLWIFGEPENTELDQVEFYTTSPDPTGVKDDPVDIGWAYLPEPVAQRLMASHFEFLPVDQTAYQSRASTDRAAFAGFPCTKSTLRIAARQMQLQAVFIEGTLLPPEKLKAAGYDPLIHLAIPYHREAQFDAKTKKRINGLDPYGMSGGPIWRFNKDREPWLAGIGTDYDASRQILKGTRLEEVLGLIQQQNVEAWVRSRNGSVKLITLDPSSIKTSPPATPSAE